MFVGVSDSALMARVGKEHLDDPLARKNVRPMNFTGKPMQGNVFVDTEGTKAKTQLCFWLDRCEAFVATLPQKVAK